MLDGCSDVCTIEVGYTCTEDSNWTSTCNNTCGDGLYANGSVEECDDNNTNNLDGCSSICSIEVGFYCPVINDTSICNNICGDGIFANGSL